MFYKLYVSLKDKTPSDLIPAYHPAATGDWAVLMRMGAGEAMIGATFRPPCLALYA